MRNEGFTLIELLVVIAICAILGAIISPVFFVARGDNRISRIVNGTLVHTPRDVDYVREHQDRPIIVHNRDEIDTIMGFKNSPPKFNDAVSKNIEVILTDGRVIKVSVMIPRGSEISTISVIPQRLEK